MARLRSWGAFVTVLVGALLPATAATAQEGTGVVHIVDWPASALEAGERLEPFTDVEVLPFLDTLALEYRYLVQDGRPAMTFALSWLPGEEGILDGERVPLEELPQDVRLIALDARADVFVEGIRADEMIISVDSLALGPAPYVYPFEAVGLDWASLFEDAGPDRARSFFRTGFELRNLRVLSVAFAAYDEEGSRPVTVTPHPRPPSRTGVYVPDPDVWIIITGRNRRPPDISGLPERPRGDALGRGRVGSPRRSRGESRGEATGEAAEPDADRQGAERRGGRSEEAGEAVARGSRRSGGKKDDEEDDDDTDLLPAAVAGAAAIGLVAFAGGTIGYYGDIDRAPIGLGSGFIRPRGGMLIRVAVNQAVLGAGDGPERLAANLFGFYRIFEAPVQPALSVGVWAEENGDDIEVTPALSLGAVGLLGPVLLQGGYDLGAGTLQFGVAYNFRYRR